MGDSLKMSLSWLCTGPVLKLAIHFALVLAALFLIVQVLRWSFQSKCPNPFESDIRVARKPYVHDQKKRDAVIKQGFSKEKVPQNVDAIIIGSGIGGMTTGVLMAKSGKKVLVLEQHDQAGGCCHTFIDKGYEFDVGIHYVGEVAKGELNRTLVDQITDGQLEWQKMEDEFDHVTIGYGDEKKTIPVIEGEGKWKEYLLERFPDEKDGIEKYFKLVEEVKDFEVLGGLLKFLPLWASWLIAKSGILKLFCGYWSGDMKNSTWDIVEGLTKNKDLQTVLTYCWGDYGSPPNESHFVMQGLLINHFVHSGGYYPIGGASEIAYNMIPIIEKSGGKVLVKADVTEIICNNQGEACGVLVKKGSEEYRLNGPIIIS